MERFLDALIGRRFHRFPNTLTSIVIARRASAGQASQPRDTSKAAEERWQKTYSAHQRVQRGLSGRFEPFMSVLRLKL